ncbi:hypothetical protein JV197_11385, partial [Vibrio furnissii]
VIIERGQA